MNCSEIFVGTLACSGTVLMASRWRPAGILFRLCGPILSSVVGLYHCFRESLELDWVDGGCIGSSAFDIFALVLPFLFCLDVRKDGEDLELRDADADAILLETGEMKVNTRGRSEILHTQP